MIKFTGTPIPITRVLTGFHSFDHAFINWEGEIGFPIRTIAELYGPNHVGKSTMWYTISGMVCKKLGGNIAMLDLEGFDHKFVETVIGNTGFEGEIKLISLDTDEDELKELADSLDQGYTVGILDSIGGIAPIGEIEGKLYEANMGRRGLLMAKLSRRILHIQRKSGKPSLVLATNHQHLRMGGQFDMLGSGPVVTPGGETKNYLASVRIKLKRKEEFPDGSYVVHGLVTKNKWGLRKKEFDMFCLSGRGFHLGLSAMIDCLNLKLATRNKGMISVGKEKIGKISTLVKKAKEEELFEPFFETLEAYAKNDEK